jgi:hypothetical protein
MQRESSLAVELSFFLQLMSLSVYVAPPWYMTTQFNPTNSIRVANSFLLDSVPIYLHGETNRYSA